MARPWRCVVRPVVWGIPANAEQAIEQNGGKKASEVLPEGDKGLFQYFEDSEGNNFAIYSYKK